MEPILTIPAKPGEPIRLGREGENLARRIAFDLTRWEKLYGPGVAQLVAQRTGETTPYPVALTLEGSTVYWTVTAADTAIHGINGKAELRYYVGETLAKSETWRTMVLDALGEPSEEPPEPYQSWIDQVLQAGMAAEKAALHQPIIQNGTWWLWNFETDQYEDSGMAAQGAQGPVGPQGPPGEQGPQGPGANTISVSLPSIGWADGAQTVQNEALVASGYAYIVTPAPASFGSYASCMVRADNVTADGAITFYCEDAPTVDLTVSIMKVKVDG